MSDKKWNEPKGKINWTNARPGKDSIDEIGVVELQTYVDNDGQLYRSRMLPILKNLQKRKQKGVYDHKKAVKAMRYAVDEGTKHYMKEYTGSTKGYLFNVPTRNKVAEDLARHFENEYDAGNRW